MPSRLTTRPAVVRAAQGEHAELAVAVVERHVERVPDEVCAERKRVVRVRHRKAQPQGEPVPVRTPVESPVPSWWSQHASEIGEITLAVVVIGGLVAITVLTEGAATPGTAPLAAEEAEILANAARAAAQ